MINISNFFIGIPFIAKFLILILVMFFVLLFLYLQYEKLILKLNPIVILWISYLLLIINMYLGSKYYSVEWAFVVFVISAVFFYDFKIDSRFLILPALLLLGYIPFLLIAKYEPLAETIAIYVYYFLVVGVVLQIIEHIKKRESKLDFDVVMKRVIRKISWNIFLFLFGFTTIAIIVGNRFYNLEIYKWTSVYFFVVSLVMFYISNSLGKETKGKQKKQLKQKTLQKGKGFSEGLEKLKEKKEEKPIIKENKIKSRFVNYFKKYFKKPPSDLKTQQLIRNGFRHRLSGDEIVEMLTDIGHDKKTAKRALDDYLKKKSKDMKSQTKLA